MKPFNPVPFPHLVLNNLVSVQEMRAINDEWPKSGWNRKVDKMSVKNHCLDLPPTAASVVARLTADDFRRQVSAAFGLPPLLADPGQYGGGLHCIKRGGFLKMHVDFNQHPSGLWRRVNLLVYLNFEWQDEWGGFLQLGMEPPLTLIPPRAGLSVVFPTTEGSLHGHPDILACPNHRERRSIAIYFYSKEPPDGAAEPHTTIYPEDQ